jgi:hypothetical protein
MYLGVGCDVGLGWRCRHGGGWPPGCPDPRRT